jgi:hypothetical protein
MSRKSTIVTLCILGALGTLGACCCCAGMADDGVPGGGQPGGGVRGGRTHFIWTGYHGGGSPGPVSGHGPGASSTSRGGFGSTGASHGGGGGGGE